MSPDIGDVLLGKLRVLRKLGEGGMGVVYEVEHTLTNHRRALKVLRPEVATDPEIAARFLREAGVAGTLGSEHVAEVQDAGRLDDGSLYVLMERLEGESLATHLRRRGSLRPGEVVELAAQLCKGLSAAHAKGIVHRDLKPDNVFLVKDGDGRLRVKLLDFGISKFTTVESSTSSGQIMGTPYYMAPEQLRDAKSATATADLYSLGVMLYELLSGERPYEAENLTELIVKVLERDHVPLATRLPDLAPALVAIVDRCMSATPSDRYGDATALRAALLELPAEPLLETRPDSVLGLAATLPSDASALALAPTRASEAAHAVPSEDLAPRSGPASASRPWWPAAAFLAAVGGIALAAWWWVASDPSPATVGERADRPAQLDPAPPPEDPPTEPRVAAAPPDAAGPDGVDAAITSPRPRRRRSAPETNSTRDGLPDSL